MKMSSKCRNICQTKQSLVQLLSPSSRRVNVLTTYFNMLAVKSGDNVWVLKTIKKAQIISKTEWNISLRQ